MRRALAEIERLLRAYGHTYAANQAEIAAGLFDEDPQAACRSLNTSEWWEGADSVAAIDLAVTGGFTAQSRHDAVVLRQSLVDVFTTLRAYGEHNDAGEIIVSQFQKWMESHI
ncbi:MAG: hypothetical protein KDJ39_07810 [Gammaproteobacteria bacterium]|nr:hypothetical protein [Gammaproteobacteria bacterium]MCP5298751.1 hypothetical protein [Chromatiaceae bacterium]